MNTHDKIELPPLPYPQIPGNDYTAGDMQEYASKAVELAFTSPEVQAWKRDAERYRWLITKIQQVYDGDYFEADLMGIYCHMSNQFKGDRVVKAEITWRDKTDEPIGLSEAIDHARRAEGEA